MFDRWSPELTNSMTSYVHVRKERKPFADDIVDWEHKGNSSD